MNRLKSPRNPRNCAMLARPFFSSSSGNFLRISVTYTAYRAAETRARMSPRTGLEAITLKLLELLESPKLTIIVPAMQRKTLKSFTQVNFSPKNAKETKNVKRLEALLKMVLDCRHERKVTNQTKMMKHV